MTEESQTEEEAKQEWINAEGEWWNSGWRQIKGFLLCSHGHRPVLLKTPDWFPFLFPLSSVMCSRCGQTLRDPRR